MAQEFFKQLLPNATIFSRGIYADPSYQVPQKVKQALTARQIVYTPHTPVPLMKNDLQQADLILCMQTQHEEQLLDQYPQYTDKIWLLTEFAGEKPTDVPDPIGLEGRAFKKQTDRLYQLVEACAQRIIHSPAGGFK